MTTRTVDLDTKTQAQVDELTRAFGFTKGSVIRTSCYGDWKGTWDYSVVFDDRVELFIANGLKHFKDILAEKVKTYTNFEKNKGKIMEVLKQVEEADKNREYVCFKGDIYPYTILDVDFIRDCKRQMGWFYITMQIADKVINYIETHMSFDIARMAEEDDYKPNLVAEHDFYVAGGIKDDDDVDFVFNNVGYSTTNHIYEYKKGQFAQEKRLYI